MSTPQFSILIPTRDRPATFRHALDSVVRQTGSFEIVIADNCSSPAVRLIAEEYANHCPNIKYLRSDTILPMSENWENGLRHCSGEYVTILGDDDALLPSTLAMAKRLVNASRATIISWALHWYGWPDTPNYWQANRLYVRFGKNEAGWQVSREILKAFYAGKVDHETLPMIYKSFVHRSCIQQVIAERGRYFSPPEIAPDVASGILNLLHAERYVYSERPLAVRGTSGKSYGAAWAVRGASGSGERRNDYLREAGKTLKELSHAALIPSVNLTIANANLKLLCKQAYCPDDPELVVDPCQVLFEVVDTLNFEPEAYDDNLADALRLAEKLNIDISARIPAKQAPNRRLSQGPYGGENGIAGISVNCDQAGIFNVSDAARLAEAITQSADTFFPD